MRIIKKRIQKPDKYLSGIKMDAKFYIGIPVDDCDPKKINKIGFKDTIDEGDCIFPNIIGSITRFNANGKQIPLKNLPKETLFRDAWIKDWHDDYHAVQIPYKRYPRKKINPPNIELTVINKDGKLIVISPELTFSDSEKENNKHIINLFLECFGMADVYHEDLSTSTDIKIKRLNWEVLPPGEYPWDKMEKHVKAVTRRFSKTKKTHLDKRIEIIKQFNPDFMAIGNGGFQRYMVFGFEDQNLYLLEGYDYGNATYVLRDDWMSISQLTKKEILDGDLQEERITHLKSWENKINNLLTPEEAF
ncbi:hypothetical protein [Ancylomarina longa]|uniref:Uncharacterized protein n=1 Tax=Ancylomarina longa TaxID=2487017 RepID=A0A434AEY6_9BACT|nr:hypothetical protein [Ancylomarina longa]RUT72934.1 hypothetical protein DLK05_15860 [Ancylomarina longa]